MNNKIYFLLLITLISISKSQKEKNKTKKKRKFLRENTLLVIDDFNFERVVKHYKTFLLFITSETCGQPCESRQSEVVAAAIKLYKHKPTM